MYTHKVVEKNSKIKINQILTIKEKYENISWFRFWFRSFTKVYRYLKYFKKAKEKKEWQKKVIHTARVYFIKELKRKDLEDILKVQINLLIKKNITEKEEYEKRKTN
jgi:hypothetical protein